MKIFCFLLFFSLNASAITPELLRENVIKNFPLIDEALMKKEAADAAITAAEGDFDHKLKFKSRNRIEDKYHNQYFETYLERNTGIRGIGLIAGHRQGSGVFPPYDGKLDTSAAGEIYAGISVPLLRNSSTDEVRTNLSLARFEREQAREEVRLKQNMYIHKALSLYYKWIAEDRILRINKELLDLAMVRENMLRTKFRRGDVERLKLTDNERTIEKRRAEIQKSQAKLKAIEAGLLLFLNDVTKLSDFTDDELNRLRLPAIQKSLSYETVPQFRILTLEKEKRQALEKLYQQSRLPGLGVDLIGARELSGSAPYDPERLQVGVRFDFPLENRKANGKTVEQSYKLQALDKRIAYTEKEIRLNFENALTIMDINFRRFETTSSEVVKTRTVAKAEQVRFRMGSSDLFVVNLREIDVADAEVRKWTSWYEFHQAILDAKLFQGTI